MALPYPTKVVLPFDIATAQDMNERHANDVALAAGTGINDGAITADKLDLTTLAFGNYSTTEVDTGFKWINGEAIYKKTINFGALPNSTAKAVPHGITNLFYIVSYEGVAKRTSDGLFQSVTRVNSTSVGNQTAFELTLTQVVITSAANLSSYDTTYITLYYIKTT